MLNLISDPWIPVRLKDGTRRVVRPHEIADPAIAAPDWPRADLNIACLELLIGLVYMADPPANKKEWRQRQAPDAARLQTRLAPLAPAFNLGGDGPRFLQDFEAIEGEANGPDMLFIDSAGANTARNNADLMVHRDRYATLVAPLAAMALYTFQSFAPSGGAGNRTSMRGGGPMVTLVDPGEGLWALVWANIPYGVPQGVAALPWMRNTRVSDGNKPPTYPEALEPPPAETFFGMPRRLRLQFDDEGRVIGVVQRPYGTNYAGWDHPLTPYYRQKPASELLPVHPRPGTFGYRHWLGIAAAAPADELRKRARCVDVWMQRTDHDVDARITIAGWAMDNMKPLNFIRSEQPLISLDSAATGCLAGMIEAADVFAYALRGALELLLKDGEARESWREVFFIRSQEVFESHVKDLKSGMLPALVAAAWCDSLRNVALTIFDGAALPGLDQRPVSEAAAIVAARNILMAAFRGATPLGVKAFKAMNLERPARTQETTA